MNIILTLSDIIALLFGLVWLIGFILAGLVFFVPKGEEMTTKKEYFSYFLAFLAVFQIILLNIQIINQAQEIKRLENQPRMVVYEVKGAGGVIDRTGTITAKNVLEGRYTVTISGYGNFLVNKEQYDSLRIGDPMPEYLKGVGS